MATNAALDKSLKKIETWGTKSTPSAWPKIDKKHLVEGLNYITSRYYDLDMCQENGYFGLDQGQYPVCGPAALSFYLLKRRGIDNFIGVITHLHETGRINDYEAPADLRKFDAIPENYWKNPNDIDKGLSRVNWMLMATLAQKETAFKFDPSKNNRMMFTFVTEMQRDIEFLFGTKKKDIDRITSWATTKKALSNLDVWNKYLNKSGSVFWLMHGNALQGKSFNHAQISDLHWVVVLSAKKNANSVTIKLFTWGEIRTITVSHDEFRKMSYESLEFIPTVPNIIVTPPVEPSAPTISKVSVTVSVANKLGAGTDYDVHFRTITKNSAENAYLLDTQNVNDFERGSTRTYGVTLKNAIKVEDLKQFRLTCAFTVKTAKFIVSRVIVKDASNGITLAEYNKEATIKRDNPLVISVNANELLKKYK